MRSITMILFITPGQKQPVKCDCLASDVAESYVERHQKGHQWGLAQLWR